MQRREFITLFGGTAATWPLAARAQQPAGRVYRVGYFAFGSREQQVHLSKAFEEGLRSLGYRVGENVLIEYRFANGEFERLPALAADMVRLGVDVIVTGNHANAAAAMKATTTIPIVMTNSTDPVSTGLVADLARPGGNVTGLSVDPGEEISGKRLELLTETLPSLSRVGILWNPDFAPNQARLTSMREATQALGLTLITAEASGLDAFEQAFATLSASEYAKAGLLLSYGPDLKDLFRRSAVFVDKIFNGAKPADLPIEQPIKYELVINLKTANSLGLSLPPAFLARADEVIE